MLRCVFEYKIQSGMMPERGSALSSESTEYFIPTDVHHQQAAVYSPSFYPTYTQSVRTRGAETNVFFQDSS